MRRTLSPSAVFYFLYFAAFGIYVPYWALYLRELGFSSMQIAIISAMPATARIFLPPVYGYVADRFQARRRVLIAGCIAQVVPLVLILQYDNYVSLLVLTGVFALLNAGVLSFTEATVQEEQEKGLLDYGKTRLWGTISFILIAVFFGILLDTRSSRWVVYGMVFFFALLSAVSVAMPEGKMQIPLKPEHLKETLKHPSTRAFLLCVFLMQLSHGTFYGFFSIYLADAGYPDSGIGLQWAISAASELTVFYFASAILGRFSSPLLLAMCFVAATLRWFLTGSIRAFWPLTAVQCLHAFTFGLFHITSMRLVHRLFPEGSRSVGQALYTSSSAGFGSVAGMLMSGYLYGAFGGRAFYFSGSATILGLAASLLLRKHEDTKP
jgi:PPP family 3-phenylpropionic acid transporter